MIDNIYKTVLNRTSTTIRIVVRHVNTDTKLATLFVPVLTNELDDCISEVELWAIDNHYDTSDLYYNRVGGI